MKDLSHRALLQRAVADGATTPDPGSPGWAWSTTENAPVYWSGSAWIKPATGASPLLNTVDEVINVDLYLNKYTASLLVSGATTLDASLDAMAPVIDVVVEGATLLIGGGPYCGLWTMGSVATLSAIPLTRWTDYGSGASLRHGTIITARAAFESRSRAGVEYPTNTGHNLASSDVDVANNRIKPYIGGYGPAFFRLTLGSGATAPGGITPGVWYRLGDPIGGLEYGSGAASPVLDLAYTEVDITSTGVNGGSGSIGPFDIIPASASWQGAVLEVVSTGNPEVSFASESLGLQSRSGGLVYPGSESAESGGYAAGSGAWAKAWGVALGASAGAYENAVSVGGETWAVGSGSIAIGYFTVAYGNYSLALQGAYAGANLPNGGGGESSLALGQNTFSDYEVAFRGPGGHYGFQQLGLSLDYGAVAYPRMLYTSTRQAAATPSKSGWWVHPGNVGAAKFDGYCVVTFWGTVSGLATGHAVLRLEGSCRSVEGTAVPSLQYLVTEVESSYPGTLTLTLTPTSISLVSGDDSLINVEMSCSLSLATTAVSATMFVHNWVGYFFDPSATYVEPAVNRQERGILLTASETLAAGNLISILNDGGVIKMRKADSNAPYASDGYVLQAVTSGDLGYFYVDGVNDAVSGLTLGNQFLSATAGATTTTAPTTAGNIVQSVGIALTSSKLLFQRGLPILLS